MKKKIFFIIIIILTFSIQANSQNDFATINIYRSKAFTIGCKGECVKVYYNNQLLINLDNGGHLEIKVFNFNKSTIKITDGSTYKSEITITPQKGNEYYFNTNARFPRVLGFELEKLDTSIKPNKLDKSKFISLTDVGQTIDNEIKKADTEWTKEKLISHWQLNGISDIEGIYERVATQIEYKLAVLKENNDYKLIYLSGANGTGWVEGDIKAVLKKTAQFGIFKSSWFMLNKSHNKDIIITFKNSTMETISEAGDGNDIYLKMYPTYDESDNSNNSTVSYKSTGTGFFIDKKGYIVTNYHVIKDSREIEVIYNQKNYLAKVIISDEQNDLAIIKILDNSFIPLKDINFNLKNELAEVGTSVFTLGFPLTDLMGENIKFTDGKVSAKSGFKGNINSYQITVPIQPGNSGGPLFDENRNLIGITSSGIDKTIANNANYAIKTKYLNLLIDEINDSIELPKLKNNNSNSLSEKIKDLSNYVVFLKIK